MPTLNKVVKIETLRLLERNPNIHFLNLRDQKIKIKRYCCDFCAPRVLYQAKSTKIIIQLGWS